MKPEDMSVEELIQYRDDCKFHLDSPVLSTVNINAFTEAHKELKFRFSAQAAEIERLKAEVERKELSIEKAKRILTMGHTNRDREAYFILTI